MGMYCVGTKNQTFKSQPLANTWILGGKSQIDWKIGGGVFSNGILCWIGNRNNQFGPLKLPYDLTTAGAPNCVIYSNILMTTVAAKPGVLASFGTIPNDINLIGVTLYHQAVGPEPGANALNLIFGPAFSIEIRSNSTPATANRCAGQER